MLSKMTLWSGAKKSSAMTTSPTWSQAARSSMRPPSTACSASRECGGARRSLATEFSRRNFGVLDIKSPRSGEEYIPQCDPAARKFFPDMSQKKTAPEGAVPNHRVVRDLLFGGDGHRQLHVDVGVQVQGHHVIAHGAQRAGRQAHFGARQLVSLRRAGLGDVRRADGAEQLAFGTGLRRDLELEVLERSGAALRVLELVTRDLLELGAACLELLHVFRRRQRRLAFRQQEVAAVAGLHLDAVADVSKVCHLGEQNDVHGLSQC